MSVSVDVLRELHRIHRQLADLKSRLTRGPKQIQAGQLTVQHSEDELVTAKASIKHTRMESDGQNLQLREREAKIADLQRKLNECKTNVEYKTLKDQIAAEKKANSVLEDEILDKLEKIDRLQQQAHEIEQKLAKMREELAKTETRVNGEHDVLEAEVQRVTELLLQSEVKLPTTVRLEYERIARSRGEEALAPVDGECCGSCYTTLTTQTMNLLQLSELVFCKSCGSLLYLAEDRQIT